MEYEMRFVLPTKGKMEILRQTFDHDQSGNGFWKLECDFQSRLEYTIKRKM